MKTSTSFKAIIIGLAAIGTTIAPAAFASSSTTVEVEFDARYLETDWGVEKIYTKLSNKAENSCDFSASRNIAARNAARDCMTDLLDDFIESANHESLTRYHEQMTS